MHRATNETVPLPYTHAETSPARRRMGGPRATTLHGSGATSDATSTHAPVYQ